MIAYALAGVAPLPGVGPQERSLYWVPILQRAVVKELMEMRD